MKCIVLLTKSCFFTILCCCLTPSIFAAQSIDKMWSVLTLNGNYGKVVYSVEPQLRLAYQDQWFQQFLSASGVGYKVTDELQLWLGQTFSADSQDAVPGDQDEYRLWEQVLWTHAFDKVTLVARTRLENRKSFSFSPWSYRIRERLWFNKPITQHLALVVSDEFFFNLNRTNWVITKTFDQNRFLIGLEQNLTQKTSILLGYMNQFLNFDNRPQLNNIAYINFRINLEQ